MTFRRIKKTVARLRPGSDSEVGIQWLVSDSRFEYSRPCFSPTGDRVLVMRAPATDNPVAVANADRSPWTLWVLPVSGGQPELFFSDPEMPATRPEWCHRTNRVAFTGILNGRGELCLIDGTGRNLTRMPAGVACSWFYPSWYADGRYIAVTDYSARMVVRVDSEDGTYVPLTDPTALWAGMCAVWPLAGDHLAVAGQPPGGVYDAGRNMIWIVRPGAVPVPLDGASGRMPAWSPDGKRLAFVSRRGSPLHRLMRRTSAVFVQETGTGLTPSGAPVRVTPRHLDAVHPKWSPDGRNIVCMLANRRTGRRGIGVVTAP